MFKASRWSGGALMCEGSVKTKTTQTQKQQKWQETVKNDEITDL